MAGHSHAANIKFRKDRVDSARSKLFSKLSKDIISAAREGGGDPAGNLRLRYAIDRAKASSMPRDNIERAIKRGTGELGVGTLEELLYEGYAPGGVAILIEALTDNRNRTASDVRSVIEKRGGSMGGSGSVSFLFKRRGVFTIAKEAEPSEEKLLELVLEVGAEDLIDEGELWEVRSEPADFHAVLAGFKERGIPLEDSAFQWIPDNLVPVQDRADAEKVLKIVEALEELDDVTGVSSNYDIPDELLAELQGG
ncbi:MAG: YebC/PmpR family DNA-binding transcriptional regulator [Planctomycetota bacterium]